MTLEEAIKHCEEKAKHLRCEAVLLKDDEAKADCETCARDHEQLAAWLTDYQRLLAEEEQRQFAEELHSLYLASKGRREKRKEDKMRLIDADEFFENYPELAIEPYINAPTVVANSATTEIKQGEWFHYEGSLFCQNCHTEFDDDIEEYCGDDVPKFCPNCGARMKGSGE